MLTKRQKCEAITYALQRLIQEFWLEGEQEWDCNEAVPGCSIELYREDCTARNIEANIFPAYNVDGRIGTDFDSYEKLFTFDTETKTFSNWET